MLFRKITCAVALTATSVYAAGNNNDNSLTLSSDALQNGSFADGSKAIGAAEVGQALSLTSKNNFINFCAGQDLTNGLQILSGSCNGIPMGQIPKKTQMVSSVITFPTTGGKPIDSGTTFNISVFMSNIQAGSFTNADATYYAAPQQLNNEGIIIGHTHVTVQNMGDSLNPQTSLDPTKFSFFKGINDDGNGKGLLQAVVTGGLPPGNYRVCTMAAAMNHQPVLMPVAQRGTPDDCTKFVVNGNNNTENAAANDGSKGKAAADLAASAVAAGPDAIDTATAAAAASTSSAASSKGGAASKGGKGSKAVDNQSSKATVAATSAAATSTDAGKGKGGKGKGGKGKKHRRSARQFVS